MLLARDAPDSESILTPMSFDRGRVRPSSLDRPESLVPATPSTLGGGCIARATLSQRTCRTSRSQLVHTLNIPRVTP